ncbi:MAG: adenosine deaminase [Aerococcus sp.]|nr:adenosine deaminase [Aerococcus sp.]
MAIVDDYIKTMPKAELHCHLDGSIPLATLKQLAREMGMDEQVMDQAVAAERCSSLKDYLQSFEVILSVLQTEEQLERATAATIAEVSKENVRYIELRFAPLLHTNQGLTPSEVIEAVRRGIARAVEVTPVFVNLILCQMRHMDQATQLKLIADLSPYTWDNVVAFDFAGDEPDNSNDEVVALACQNAGYALTMHAGECGCAHNILAAIKLGASRIGHGVAVKSSSEVVQLAKDKQVHFEVCPTSNYQTGALPSIAASHLKLLMDKGISCSVNTDNRTVSNTTLSAEFEKVTHAFDFTIADIYHLSTQAVVFAFATQPIKQQLLEEMHAHYQQFVCPSKTEKKE